ncbi:MAG TPA: hypothetical protein PLZ99_00675 [Parcubacteria group bacterium]|jgi:hypothetical protein|nr:hypothetical protein [Parcubacteria group bacterium]
MSTNSKSVNTFLFQDFALIVFSILLAVMLVKTGVLSEILDSIGGGKYIGSFFAGIFFTSFFTTAPAIATLLEISQHNPIFTTALFGAMGAVLGDLIIFRFIRDRLGEHVAEVVGHNSFIKTAKTLFKLRYFRWFTFLLGGFLIASPLPDELGIGLLGFSRMKSKYFIPVSFVFNFIGIVLIGMAGKYF